MKVQRLQFDFSPDLVGRLDAIVTAMRAASRAEAVRRSIIFVARIIEAEREGSTLIARASDGTERKIVLVMG